MKLRNKKTGEIKDLQEIMHEAFSEHNEKSLMNLEKEWEDYEEPKEYYCITGRGNFHFIEDIDDEGDKERKAIGNYFETKEEAEKAVEKLKAWKLLRDECDIKFDGIIRDENAMLKAVKLSYDRHTVTVDRMRECTKALYLLFGEEVKNDK